MVYSASTLLAGVATAAFAGAALGLYLGAQTLRSPSECEDGDEGHVRHGKGVLAKFTCLMCRRKKTTFPKRLILVRHGESEGNIDQGLYCHVPDNAMHLTQLGFEQAVAAGKSLKQIIGNESLVCMRVTTLL